MVAAVPFDTDSVLENKIISIFKIKNNNKEKKEASRLIIVQPVAKSSSDNFIGYKNNPHLITQSKLNDLMRFSVAQVKSGITCIQADPSTKVSIYHDVKGLFEEMNEKYQHNLIYTD